MAGEGAEAAGGWHDAEPGEAAGGRQGEPGAAAALPAEPAAGARDRRAPGRRGSGQA